MKAIQIMSLTLALGACVALSLFLFLCAVVAAETGGWAWLASIGGCIVCLITACFCGCTLADLRHEERMEHIARELSTNRPTAATAA